MSLKRSAGLLTQTTPPISPAVVVRAYKWERDGFAIYEVQTDGRLHKVGDQTASATNTITGINRLDFYSSSSVNDKPLLLRIDLIPGTDSGVDPGKIVIAGSSITISGRVRNALWQTPGSSIRFQVELSRAGQVVSYDSFFFRDDSNTKWQLRLGRDLEAALRAPATIKIGSAPNFAKIGFTNFINLTPAEPLQEHPCNPALEISFPQLISARGGHVIRFTREFKSVCRDDEVELKAFAGEKNKLSFNDNPGLTLVQQPSVDIANPPRPPLTANGAPISKWIVRVDGIPSKSVGSFWEDLAGRYYDALRTVEGGRPASFLPELFSFNTTMNWGLAYSITDALSEDQSKTSTYEWSDGSTPSTSVSIRVDTLSLQPRTGADISAKLIQLKSHDDQPINVSLKVLGTARGTSEGIFEDEAYRGVVLPLDDFIGSVGSPAVRMGSLDLVFGGTKPTSNPESGQKTLTYFARIVPKKDSLSVHMRAQLGVLKVSPGGQDDVPLTEAVPEGGGTDFATSNCELAMDDPQFVEPGVTPTASPSPTPELLTERQLEQHFHRTPPLVIDLGTRVLPDLNGRQVTSSSTQSSPDSTARFLLQITEDAQAGGSQTVAMKLLARTGDQDSDKPRSVIVLDRNPFLIARVQYPSFLAQTLTSGTATVAEWRNRGLEGANWEVVSRRKPFDLYLPPQGMGEEMEKKGNIKNAETTDFRFSPPAKFTLNASEQTKNLGEVPWNLRRILGYPGQRNPGAGVVFLQFEMLYGLSCSVDYPFLRLAEIAALIGAIPGRLPPTPLSSPVMGVKKGDQKDKDRALTWEAWQDAYQRARTDWAVLYRRYLARLGVLQPWDTHRLPPEFQSSTPPGHDLLLNQNVVCRIRTGKGKADETPAELADPFNPAPSGLKGGVTWGFESANVYHVVLEKPETRDATITDPYFSSLGGWGRMRASFNNGLSTVYGDVAMGRTYSYKLERLGRIGVWWNLAKHVIVYERTVVPAPRMEGQEPLLGRAVLRKVREYVEILETSRRFPDGKNADVMPPAQRGCVAACTFDQKEFDVQSSWSSDIGTTGWKIPLWNTGADPTLFPKPKVFLELVSQVGDKSSPAPCLIKNPQNLYFYTETKSDSDPNPHEWAPAEDVDYVDLPMCKPIEDFVNGQPKLTTPDDPAIHPGYGPCTFVLEPGPGPADLIVERVQPGKQMVALLENVTMMRAHLDDEPKGEIKKEAVAILRVRESIVLGYQKLLQEFPPDTQTLDDSAIQTLINKVEPAFSDLRTHLGNMALAGDALTKTITDREAALKASVNTQVDKLKNEVIQGFTDAIAHIPATAARPREWLTAAVNHTVDAFQEKVLLLRLSPGMLPKLVKSYSESANRFLKALQSSLKAEINKINQLVAQVPSDVDLSDQNLFDLQNRIRQLIAMGGNDLSALIYQRPPEDWLPDLSEALNKNYLDDIKKKVKDVEGILRIEKVAQKDIVQWKANTQALLTAISNWNPKLVDLAKILQPSLEDWRQTWIDDRTKMDALRRKLIAAISDDVAKTQADVLSKFNTEFDAFQKELASKIEPLSQPTKELLDLVTYDLTKRLPEFIPEELANKLKDGRAALEAHRDELLRSADSYYQRAIRPAINKKLGALPVFAAPDSSIRLLRAFGQAPEVKNLEFPGRKQMAYFYRSLEGPIEITAALSRVKQASNISEALQPIGIEMPTRQLFDRLVPPDLKKFNLSDIFPNFAGLNLSDLFKNLKMPDTGENVRITHGVDVQSGRAWVETNVNIRTSEPATLFTIGPVTLRLPSAAFEAKLRMEAGTNQSPQRTVQGSIFGDFELVVAGTLIVTFKDTKLSFDDHGGFKFHLSPKNVVLPELLSFVSQFLSALGGSDSGFSVKFRKDGVEARLSLPFPDTASVTSGIANLKLGVTFGLTVVPDFMISVMFSLGRHDSPFTITGFLLGGAGYIEVTTSYTPAKRTFAIQVEIAVAMSGSVAIAVGPINGGVYIYFGIKNIYRRETNGGDSTLTMGAFLLFIGKVQLLGLVEVEISELLEVRYNGGKLTGHGRLAMKIKICWCFTLEVAADLEYTLGEGAKSSTTKEVGAGHPPGRRLAAANHAWAQNPPPPSPPDYYKFAKSYIEMLV